MVALKFLEYKDADNNFFEWFSIIFLRSENFKISLKEAKIPNFIENHDILLKTETAAIFFSFVGLSAV